MAETSETSNGQSEADQIFRYRLGLSPVQRIQFATGEVGPVVCAAVEDVVSACEDGIPLAYALGRAEFCGLVFEVNNNVLIPRPETEWLVERAESWLADRRGRAPDIVDLGCGSGCIGIALAVRHPEVRIFLSDISQAALAVARDNAARHGVLDRCTFNHGDWLSWAGRRERFDAILCNPPYVTNRNDPRLEDSVRKHEPDLALFLDDDPEEFYFRLGRKSVSHLNSGGLFAVEVGYDTAWQARSAFEKIKAIERGKEIHDFAGIERVIWGIRR